MLHPPCVIYSAGAFENTVQALYKYVVPKPKSECSKMEQLGVSFGAGYIAGVLCAVISHPADNLVSKMNAQKGVPVSLGPPKGGSLHIFSLPGLCIPELGSVTAAALCQAEVRGTWCPGLVREHEHAGLACRSHQSQCMTARPTYISPCVAPHTQAGDIIKDMGWMALFTRGLGLRIFMIGSLTGLQWGIYDAYKVSVGLPTTGSAQPVSTLHGLPAESTPLASRMH
eukprot:544738-Pelagomonas_calceolata.AAC.4